LNSGRSLNQKNEEISNSEELSGGFEDSPGAWISFSEIKEEILIVNIFICTITIFLNIFL
jgi:hypothetical protein